MFCYQCEQTAKGKACDRDGVCGKTPEVGGAPGSPYLFTYRARRSRLIAGKAGVSDNSTGPFICKALFSTLTNVNFDPDRFREYIIRAASGKKGLLAKAKAAGTVFDLSGPLGFEPSPDMAGLQAQGEQVPPTTFPATNEDILSLKNILLIGIKGACRICGPRKHPGQARRIGLQLHTGRPGRDL